MALFLPDLLFLITSVLRVVIPLNSQRPPQKRLDYLLPAKSHGCLLDTLKSWMPCWEIWHKTHSVCSSDTQIFQMLWMFSNTDWFLQPVAIKLLFANWKEKHKRRGKKNNTKKKYDAILFLEYHQNLLQFTARRWEKLRREKMQFVIVNEREILIWNCKMDGDNV